MVFSLSLSHLLCGRIGTLNCPHVPSGYVAWEPFFCLVPTIKYDLLLHWIEFTLGLTNSEFWCIGRGRWVWIIEEFSVIWFFQSRILRLSSGLYNITRIKTLFEARSFVWFPAISQCLVYSRPSKIGNNNYILGKSLHISELVSLLVD